ncbi:hypothetical protein [Jidongwangia harbinensis]|uniref:hypothetical protein n=1 Tax=Jidongwangia harbinensis TaxID=2878561 RepID=UPI001CD99A90|nr:hypothetical protein [Jidongwangia harbinensis]MCA2216898.1 hypothetical protein [Jidongwangia harbinensis]
MLERDDADLIAYLAERPGAGVFSLRSGDEAAAMAALRDAADAVRAIPHPDEPGEPLPNWVDALLGDDGPTLHLDLQDRSDHAPQVIAAIVGAVEAAGADGRLTPVRPPEPPFDYDPEAHILGEPTYFLDELDGRGLPPAFPPGFPVPAGAALVIAQQSTQDTWQHAAWRRSRPFAEYRTVLHRFGCELEAVDATHPYLAATGMTRHLFRHPAGTGSVSFYAAARRHYVSVVWRPAA